VLAEFAFRQLTGFTVGTAGPLPLKGLRLRLNCSRRWFAQRVTEDVTTGLYDCINRKLIVPDQETYTIGTFTHDGWYEVDAPEITEPGPGEFQLKLTLLNPIKGDPSQGTPDIDALIAERAVRCL